MTRGGGGGEWGAAAPAASGAQRHLRLAPDRAWMESYLDLLREMLEFTGLDEDDPRLVLSVPKSRSLPATVNLRYVLSPYWKGEPLLGFIVGPEVAETMDPPHWRRRWRFSARGREEPEETPSFVRVPGRPDEVLTGELKEHWREAVLREVEHGSRSPFSRHHEPLVYRVAMDLEYRSDLLDEAFGSGAW